MNQSKYIIAFDTNIIWEDRGDNLNELFNESFKDFVSFVSQNKIQDRVQLTIPQLVLEERITQCIRRTNQTYLSYENLARQLVPFDIKIPLTNLTELDIRKVLTVSGEEFLKKNKIELIQIPFLAVDDIIKRSLGNVLPFRRVKKNSDVGFRDTIIWLSILQKAGNDNSSNFIFCTNNKSEFQFDILQKEFSTFSKCEFVIIENLAGLKEYLDGILRLNLKLKQKYEEINQEIKKQIGEIMVQVNAYTREKEISWEMSSMSNERHSLTDLVPRVFMGGSYAVSETNGTTVAYLAKDAYDFKGITILNIEQKEENIYEATIDLEVMKRLLEDNISDYTVVQIWPLGPRDKQLTILKITLIYDASSKTIKLNKMYASSYQVDFHI